MALKADIKKAITANTNYIAVKVWKPEVDEYSDGSFVMRIEINVRKRYHKKPHVAHH